MRGGHSWPGKGRNERRVRTGISLHVLPSPLLFLLSLVLESSGAAEWEVSSGVCGGIRLGLAVHGCFRAGEPRHALGNFLPRLVL